MENFLTSEDILRYKDEIKLKSSLIKRRSSKKYIYIISNSAFKGWYKIGITNNIEKRLSSYQTHDPNKGFFVEFVTPTENSELKEMIVCKAYNSKSEWIKETDINRIIHIINSI